MMFLPLDLDGARRTLATYDAEAGRGKLRAEDYPHWAGRLSAAVEYLLHIVDRPAAGAGCDVDPHDVRHGDVWRDGEGDLWLAQTALDDDAIYMHGAHGIYAPDAVQAEYGLVERVHREAAER